MRISLHVDIYDGRITPSVTVATASGHGLTGEALDAVQDGNNVLGQMLEFADGLKR